MTLIEFAKSITFVYENVVFLFRHGNMGFFINESGKIIFHNLTSDVNALCNEIVVKYRMHISFSSQNPTIINYKIVALKRIEIKICQKINHGQEFRWYINLHRR